MTATTEPTTLADWLLEQAAADEQDAAAMQRDLDRWERERARNGPDGSQASILVTEIPGTFADPARALAVARMVRELVALHEPVEIYDWQPSGICATCSGGTSEPEWWHPTEAPCPTLRALVGIYADRPGAERWA